MSRVWFTREGVPHGGADRAAADSGATSKMVPGLDAMRYGDGQKKRVGFSHEDWDPGMPIGI